jgi:hypothetical protein
VVKVDKRSARLILVLIFFSFFLVYYSIYTFPFFRFRGLVFFPLNISSSTFTEMNFALSSRAAAPAAAARRTGGSCAVSAFARASSAIVKVSDDDVFF